MRPKMVDVKAWLKYGDVWNYDYFGISCMTGDTLLSTLTWGIATY